MKKIFTFLMVLCLTSFGVVQAQTSFFSEDFESGSMPSGWTTDGPGTWSVGSGDYSTSTGAGQGTYNAKITHGTTGDVTKLITPAINLASAGSAELSFMHVQRSWSGDIDQLRVYYRTSSSGSWNLLEAYTSAVSSWTTHSITLSDFSGTYQIAFEYTDKYGYGVGIDNISIVGETVSCTLPTNVHIVGEIGPRNATIAWDAESGDMFQYTMISGIVTDFSTVSWDAAQQLSTVSWNNLSPDSDYTFAIRKYCSAADQSPVVSLPIHTDIACPAPTGLAIVPNSETAHGATLSWTGSSSSNSYVVMVGVPDTEGTVFNADFETGDLSQANFTSTADYPFTVVANTHSGAYCAKSNNGGQHNKTADMVLEVNMTSAGTLSFSAMVSSERSWDKAYFSIDGTTQSDLNGISGAGSWIDYEYTLAAGTHTLRWYYTKDSSGNSNDDCFYVDDIEITGLVPSTWSEYTANTNSITISDLNPATSYFAKVKGNCGSDGYSQETGMIGFTTLESCPVPTALNVPETTITGHGATLLWTADNDSYNIRLGEPTYLVNADFEDNQIPASFTNDASYPWTVVANTHSGAYCAKSASGNNSATSALELSVTLENDETLTFSAMVSSESGYDIAYFSIDGTNKIDGISGAGNWIDYSYPLAAGTHTLRWYYTKDSSVASNDDCFYVDDIKITNGSTVLATYTSNTTSYNFTGLNPENTYIAQVQGVCGGEPTDWSETVSFTTGVACPAPTNLVAGTPDAHTVALSWTETGGATAWQICLNGDEENLVDVTERDVTITEGVVAYTLTGLISETDYTVKVRANCGSEDGVSGWSNSVSFTTAIGCPAPTNLTVSNIEPNSATVSWEGTANSHNLRYRTLEETDMVTVILTTGDVWGDGSGYQMLLDADATAYGTIIPESGNLSDSGDASDAIYNQFEYKIPTNADGALTTSNIVVNNSVAITIFPGTYDWCITNPTPGDRVYIAANNGNIPARYDDYVFEPGKTYEFEVVKLGSGDGVNLNITDNRATNAGDWTVLNDVTSPQTLTLLDGAFYQVEVQGTCDDNEESKWVAEYFETPSNCTAPEALLVSDLDFSSATLSWTGLHDSYNMQYRTAAHRQTFFFEDFDSQPATWTISNCSWWIPSSASPDYFVGVGSGSTGVTAYMISPELPAYAAGSVVEFIQRHNGEDINFQVGFSSTTNDYDAFTWGDEVAATSSLAPYSEVIPDGIKYIAIRVIQAEGSSANIFVNNFGVYSATVPAGEWTIVERVTSPYELTDIDERTAYEWQVQGIYETCEGGVTEWSEMSTFTTPAACADPTGLVVSNISVNSAVITWVPGEATQTAWQICINDDEEHPIDVTETIYNMTELTEETNYVVKVRGNCDANGYSEWMSYEFTTRSSCDYAPWDFAAGDVTATSAELSWEGYKDNYEMRYRTTEVAIYPVLEESFEDGTMPTGWTQSGPGTWNVAAGYGYNSIGTHSGTYNAVINHSNRNDETFLISPMMDLSGQNDLNLNFWFINYNWGTSDIDALYVYYRVDEGDWTELWSTTEDHQEWTASGAIALPNLAANYQIGFKMIDKYGHGVGLDDITIGEYVQIAPAGEWVNVSDPVTSPYTLSGLTPNTEYEVQVRGAGCGDDVWSESVTFTTEPVTTDVQTITLSEGWNWISFYVEISLDDLKAALTAALPSATSLQIKSRTQTTTYNGTRWRGALAALDVTQMYMIEVPEACEITLEGAPIDPAEHPITITPGANWIAFPFNAEMNVTNAFAGFAVANDALSSRAQTTTYNGSRWRGALSTLAPGQGYIYNSAATENRTFTFPTAK